MGPETRSSLIAGLNEPASHEVWEEFVQVYRPLVIRVALAKGLQHSDADDLAQEVMSAVAKAINSFQSNGEGSFRRWLYQITRNLAVNQLTRGAYSGRRGPVGSGDSEVLQMLHQAPAADDRTATQFRLEYRRMRFAEAADRIRDQFSDPIWDSFWLTAVEGRSIADVAKRLSKSEGAVRVARCRVLSRLRQAVQDDSMED